jgi:hypothetical protein
MANPRFGHQVEVYPSHGERPAIAPKDSERRAPLV